MAILSLRLFNQIVETFLLLNIIHRVDNYSSSLARTSDKQSLTQAVTPEHINEDARGCHFFEEAALSYTSSPKEADLRRSHSKYISHQTTHSTMNLH